MPNLSNEDAIIQYYEQVKDKYPGIEFEDFRKICRTPADFVKSMMRGTGLPIIMIKHLGKFIPSILRVKKQLLIEANCFENGVIDEETYIFRKTYFQNFINDYNDETTAEIIDDTE